MENSEFFSISLKNAFALVCTRQMILRLIDLYRYRRSVCRSCCTSKVDQSYQVRHNVKAHNQGRS